MTSIIHIVGNWGYLVAIVLAFVLSFGYVESATRKKPYAGHSGSGAAIAAILAAILMSGVFIGCWYFALR
jgi:hypothetical protein